MPQTTTIPWSQWDRTLDKMGEWLIVGSIASLGLPAIPGAVSLIALLAFFSARQSNRTPAELERESELKSKSQESRLNKHEEIELSRLSSDRLLNPPVRDTKTYTIGWLFWLASMVYLVGMKGFHCDDWIPK